MNCSFSCNLLNCSFLSVIFFLKNCCLRAFFKIRNSLPLFQTETTEVDSTATVGAEWAVVVVWSISTKRSKRKEKWNEFFFLIFFVVTRASNATFSKSNSWVSLQHMSNWFKLPISMSWLKIIFNSIPSHVRRNSHFMSVFSLFENSLFRS